MKINIINSTFKYKRRIKLQYISYRVTTFVTMENTLNTLCTLSLEAGNVVWGVASHTDILLAYHAILSTPKTGMSAGMLLRERGTLS